jgi:lincosamide nucleotidyltransferase A/C/D/E
VNVAEVHAVLEALNGARCPLWIGGGWGVDALAGRQTRAHRDLDLLIVAAKEDTALTALAGLGYAVETDWRPVRVEVGAPGRGWVDLHPVVFDAEGNGVQAGLDGARFSYPRDCFTTGRIGERTVPCLTVECQLRLHQGYAPRPVDLADLEVLRNLSA